MDRSILKFVPQEYISLKATTYSDLSDARRIMKLYKGKALQKKRKAACWQAWILFAIVVIVGLIESP